MLETPGRKLFRSPLPLGEFPKSPDSSFNMAQNPSNTTGSITDVETHKNPSVPQPSSQVSVADVETRKSLSVPQKLSYSNGPVTGAVTYNKPYFSQNPAPHPVAQTNTYRNPPFPQNPMPYNGSMVHMNAQNNPPFPQNSSGVQNKTRKKSRYAQLSKRGKILLLVSVAALLLPSLLIVFELVNGVILYSQVQGGLSHLQAAGNVFHGGADSDTTKYFDPNKLQQAQAEINAAHDDFVSMSDKLDHDDSIGLFAGPWPAQMTTARALGHIATDATVATQQLVQTAIDIAPSVAPSLRKSAAHPDDPSPQPYITPASFQKINKALDAITPLIHDMSIQVRGVSLDSLPISEKQRQTIASFLPLLPALDVALSQEHTLRDTLGWIIGVGGQRSFLVEPMDRAELRATGGFTGQFGELVVNGGHMAPLKLKNIGKYEEDHTTEGSAPDPTVYPKVVGQSAPAPYVGWWPIGNFGLRDANVSADFPTSAKIAIDRYNYEFGGNLNGLIIFTPTLIKQILHVTGPITIPAYNETITENNLEDRLHYYQLDNVGIRKEELVEHVEDNQQARKLFTQRVTTTLMSTATHLPTDKMLPMANQLLNSMKTRDLQIYVTNPQLEGLIGKYAATGALDRSNNHDGLFIAQSNLSANKASQYVTTAVQDTITLDDKGGATHSMQMTLDYQQKGPVYGPDTYRDYVRVYVPENSQLIAGNGFDQRNKPYCGDEGSAYRACSQDVYGDGSLVCSSTIQIGFATSYLGGLFAGDHPPLDVTGQPQNQQSDESGRAMFGGWVVIPKNCTMKVTLSWYVPPMSQHAYSLLLQPQASVFPLLDLSIQPAPGTCSANQGKALRFSGTMNGADTFFTVKQQGSKCSL